MRAYASDWGAFTAWCAAHGLEPLPSEPTTVVLYLTDLGSSNGTFLNGKRLKNEGIEVRPGDDIDVGNTRLTVVGTAPQAWT